TRKSLDRGRAREVTQDERMRRRAVDQAEGDARVRGMEERALTLDPEHLAATGGALDHQLLRGPGGEVGDDRVDGDPPAGDRDARLPGGNEDRPEAATLCLAVELQRDRHLPDRAVGADGEEDTGVESEIRAGRHVQTGGRLAEVAELHPVPPSQ